MTVEAADPDGFDVDLFVIGGGSGGVRAARVAAGHGARVMLAEEYRLGGTCVIRGCVPKKLLVYAGRFSDAFDDACNFGWEVAPGRFDWPTLVAAKDREIGRLEALYAEGQAKAGVEVVPSRATLVDAHTVRVASTGALVRARTILIATGSRPEIYAPAGVRNCITSDEVFDLAEFPRRLVIGGAGYIAMEFASLFQALGAEVTVVCRGEKVLRGFDEDVRDSVAMALEARGVTLLLRDSIVSVADVRDGPTRLIVRTQNGAEVGADQVLLAFGRIPNTTKLGLEAAGVRLNERGAVSVDASSRSSVPHIYAVGDVTDRVNLTPVAIREGHAFADTVFGGTPWNVEHYLIPTAVFTTPEVGTLGLTELEARERHRWVDVHRAGGLSRSAPGLRGTRRAMYKVVVEGGSGRVLGLHVMAEGAGDLIQVAAVAVRLGTTVNGLVDALIDGSECPDDLLQLRKPALSYKRAAAEAITA